MRNFFRLRSFASYLPVLLLLTLPIGLGGCETESADSTAFSDDLDRSVQITPPVDRVIPLAPNLTELTIAASGADRLVAATVSDDYPPDVVESLPRVQTLPIDYEQIVTHEPDLVLATDQVNSPDDAAPLKEMGLPVYFFSFATVDDIFDGIRTLGTLFETAPTANATADSLRTALDTLQARTASETPPRVLVLVGDDTLYAFGDGSYVHTLIEAAGGESITDHFASAAPTLNEEFVLEAAPDVIIGLFGEDYDPEELLRLHPTWHAVPAVANDRVYSINADLIARPGPRVVEGAYRIAALLHPSLDLPDSSAD